jgi:hypothetical protein
MNFIKAFEARARGDKEATKALAVKNTAGFVGVTDCPFANFAPELAEAFPDAKVVLVTRDPDKWWPSLQFIMRHIDAPIVPYLTWPIPGSRYFTRLVRLWVKDSEKMCAEAGKPLGPGEYFTTDPDRNSNSQ